MVTIQLIMWWLRIGLVAAHTRCPRPQYVRRPYWGPTWTYWNLTFTYWGPTLMSVNTLVYWDFTCLSICQVQVRDDRLPKFGCFLWKKFEGGGGVIFDPKNYIANFLVLKRYIAVVNFWKNVQKRGGGMVGHLQSKKFHCKFTHVYEFLWKSAMKFPKIGRGGRSKAVWTFFQKNI